MTTKTRNYLRNTITTKVQRTTIMAIISNLYGTLSGYIFFFLMKEPNKIIIPTFK